MKTRPRPKHLAEKLLAIRQRMGASQNQMNAILDMGLSVARISEYEHGVRQPNLLVLLRYARVADVSVEELIDDAITLPKKRA